MYGKGGTENQTDSSSYTTAPNAEQNIDMDVSRVNHDIALLKLEPDESVTSASTDNEYSDILDTSLVIEQYAAYDSSSENSNISVSSPFFPACLEKQSVSSLSGVSNNGVGGYVGAFKVPSETERFSPEYLATLGSPIESGLPSQARCQLVGHSPSFSHRVQENGTDNTLFWKLRNFQSFVTSSDFSLPYIFCISRSSASERERCARRFIQNTSGEESATNMELTQLIRSGFKGIRTGAFLNDQGLALFCQRHDGRWFLNGLYNWINLKRNFMIPNFREAIHRPQAWTNSDSKMGISLGTDYFTMLTPSLNHWIENTLIDACPGEFSCYPPDSMLHLCIAPDRVCDGIIDCAANFADEKGCPSGCSYDPYFDAYYTYYSGLQNSNVFIPADIYNFGGNYSSVHRGALRGWINDTSNDRNIIRFNQVDGVKVKSCNWVIKAPAGKVAVLVIPKINSNSDRNGGTTYIISGRRKIQHDRSSGPNYYTSIPGQSVTFMLSPINGQQYLSEIRTHHFEYYLEDIGECRNQHRCGDGRCVSPHKVCNGDFDCSDLSDEINCPS
uniref:Uncharacterized protein n=1 Tax=Ciona savignyi TaxID=51511 RepID=H2Y858_CIOSA